MSEPPRSNRHPRTFYTKRIRRSAHLVGLRGRRKRIHSRIRPVLHPLLDLERTGHVPRRHPRHGKSRGKGIGKLLFDQLIEEARARQFKRIVWQVLEWNEPAINFYKKYQANLDPEWWNGSIDLN